MAEFNQNLWAPWRMEYIRSLGDEAAEDGCFLCRYWEHPANDREDHILWRTATAFAVMNRFPYTNGHLLIAHAAHKADLVDLTDDELAEMSRSIRDGVEVLRAVLNPHGFNVGYNVGHCAGAGLPGHLHAHIVPRWTGDTNFMAVIGDYRVVPESLDKLWAELVKRADAAGFR
ncbi:MAG: HIT domain-containing protein [Phycisphaerae bacterium]|jgi:ATP adenylyltransferase